ncbi:MAG: acetyl-CoA carboxylase biotin carboxyl carrier protein [Alphaproteobacteria bacterium]|nr:acetyl-CoA carboxylase biotin carboxyl carrier protein [Alphaproteobacteria bacterium]
MAKPTVDSDQIRELAKLLEETGLTEVEVTEGDRSIRVARGGSIAAAMPATPVAAPPVPTAASEIDPGAVTSPMVGTIYLAQGPGAEPFVKVGSRVAEGDTLFIVEAMKVMNPILAPRGGTVKSILVEDAKPVEFGETLLILE